MDLKIWSFNTKQRQNMKTRILKIVTTIAAVLMIVTMAGATASSHGRRYDTMPIKRCVDSKHHTMETLGKVTYYVHKDTLLMDRRFSWVQLIYTSRKTGKMDIGGNGGSFIIHDNDRRGRWWYAVVSPSKYLNPKDYYVSAIILRSCHASNESKTHIAWDAYLYNKTKEIARDQTMGEPTKSIKQLLDYINR